MSEAIHALAGQPATRSTLVDIARLLGAFTDTPDPREPAQRVAFGTSGHRGSSLNRSFTAAHVAAVTQAICDYRRGADIDGPLFLGFDTHALSRPAFDTALEVLAGNGVVTLIAAGDEYTPTPALSHAIVNYNRGRTAHRADGIVVTPSHNPPDSGGFKYNPPHGGPADTAATAEIERRANAYLEAGLAGVRRVSVGAARRAATTHEFDFVDSYVSDLGSVVDFDRIRAAGIRMGVDPLGGAGVHYWSRIAERFRIDLDVVSDAVDPTFAFMSLDWDGRIRMDPSSSWAMQRLIGLRDRYDVAFACDTDHDRHGVVAPSVGLMPANDYLSALAWHLFAERDWPAQAALGKTVVSSALLDRIATRFERPAYVTPVGFKWFAQGLCDSTLAFACEESAGASLLRRDGGAWCTDKDGIAAALLSAEIVAASGCDPGAAYARIAGELGRPCSARIDAPANAAQRKALAALKAGDVLLETLAGDPVDTIADSAPGNGAPIGGIRVATAHGWFAARPSGTEDIYKIYGESFRDETHLRAILAEAQRVVDAALAGAQRD